jgi:hypothetical protein
VFIFAFQDNSRQLANTMTIWPQRILIAVKGISVALNGDDWRGHRLGENNYENDIVVEASASGAREEQSGFALRTFGRIVTIPLIR